MLQVMVAYHYSSVDRVWAAFDVVRAVVEAEVVSHLALKPRRASSWGSDLWTDGLLAS